MRIAAPQAVFCEISINIYKVKIALFIFRFGPSHGSILQTYALTRTLESMGHQVTIIDRQRPITLNDYNRCLRRVVKGLLKGRFTWQDFYLGSFSRHAMKNLNEFIDRELKAQTITLTSYSKLRKIGNDDFSAYIVGSDQTWRPKFVYDIFNYYLDFVPQNRQVKRLAYAVSFGTAEWEYSREQENKCKELVGRFDGVSVREIEGVYLCKEHFNIEALHVLDPILLLRVEEYKKMILDKLGASDKYVGYNFLDIAEEKMEIVNIIAQELGLSAKQVNSITEDGKSTQIDVIAPSIENWLAGIANAEFVITDSFHAMVYAIIFHKQFVVIGNEARGMARFTSLLKTVELEKRLLVNKNGISESLIKEKIEWTKVEEELEYMRTKSITFIKNYL